MVSLEGVRRERFEHLLEIYYINMSMIVSTCKFVPRFLAEPSSQSILRFGLSLFSLVQFFVMARLTQPWLMGGPFEWAGHLRLPALVLSIALVLWLGRDGLRWPHRPQHLGWVVALTFVTLSLTYIAVFVLRVWVPRLPTGWDMALFLATGLLAEEFWFRGVLFSLWQRTHSARVAVLVTAILFGLSHWQYHGFAFTVAAAVQIGYTLLLGLVFGVLRGQTRSAWAATGLHLVVNLIAAAAIRIS